jgi:hypothetical protein
LETRAAAMKRISQAPRYSILTAAVIDKIINNIDAVDLMKTSKFTNQNSRKFQIPKSKTAGYV